MKPQTIEKLVWVLIYGGLVVGIPGLWTLTSDTTDNPVALGLAATGAVLVSTGFGLLWLRSRMGMGTGPGGSPETPELPSGRKGPGSPR